ncbi:MAG TPA: ABC transporter permease subunit [Gaiellaceae bacterium]|nr:ABC transporter permease subunit [Gaiellaceae bacterium]
MSGQSISAESPATGAPPGSRPGFLRRNAAPAAFLAPAFILLVVWVVYPAVYTFFRSFFDDAGGAFDGFVGVDNYKRLFTDDNTLQAIKNNAIWVGVVPALVTAIGLIFAVLTERVSWAVAFKTVVFMPMAISLFAAGVIWRAAMYQQEPERGAINAVVAGVKDAIDPAGVLSQAQPSTDAISGTPQGGLELGEPIAVGDTALLGLTGIRGEEVPADAVQAVAPEPLQGGITGVVWRDFKPGGGNPGEVESEEVGLPGVTVELRGEDGGEVASTTSAADGTFAFEDVEEGRYQVAIGPETFAESFGGIAWLSERLITMSVIISYIWVWAGFAMVVIAAGLAAIPRDVLEAARTDGGSEWQVFRRVTVPLLAPVLTVVFITMLINVLKVFDIVLSVAPGSVQDDATVIALEMWRESFTAARNFGFGSAIAVFLFLLVIPILLLNVRRFRREV